MDATPEMVWSASDYAPTARRLRPASALVAEHLAVLLPPGSLVADIGAGHGDTARALLDHGFVVDAVEPAARMRDVGATRAPEATWLAASGERTVLDTESVDAVASSFGSMFCDPAAGPAAWARILRPGGWLVMTAWSQEGFLADMTARMMAALAPGADAEPPHMTWCEPGVAEERLSPWFDGVQVAREQLLWHLSSLDEGMELYQEGSPTHAWILQHAGARREAVLDALRHHLLHSADADGTIRATTGFGIITAVRH